MRLDRSETGFGLRRCDIGGATLAEIGSSWRQPLASSESPLASAQTMEPKQVGADGKSRLTSRQCGYRP